jgi:anaerobic magnesium-protoporphyrin IX monomethyl ester cyclase
MRGLHRLILSKWLSLQVAVKMRVLLIWTEIDTQVGTYTYHFGIGSIAAFLKQAGHCVQLLTLYGELPAKEDFLAKIEAFNPDLIALSLMTNQWSYSRLLAKWIKEKRRESLIVGGGNHPTLAPEEVISDENIDIVCRGEGEYALKELLECMETGSDFQRVKNLWVKSKNGVTKNPVRPLIADLDALPHMDREMLPFERFLEVRRGVLPVMAGRGCPFNCSYCCNPALNRVYQGKGKILRRRSPLNVIDEIQSCQRRYKSIRFVDFKDEVFSLDQNWLEEFCELYPRKIDLPFGVCLRPENLDYQILRKIRKAGGTKIYLGTESGNEWLRREILNRKMSNNDIIEVFRMADSLGFKTASYAMVGLPYETRKMIEETIELHRIVKPNYVQLSIFYPYVGTKLYDLCRKNNWLTGDEASSYYERSVINQPSISKEEIRQGFEKFRDEAVKIGIRKEDKGLYYNFLLNLDKAEISTDRKEYVGLTKFTGEYEDNFWLLSHPYSEIAYQVEILPKSKLNFDIGMHPLTYDKPGEGVLFEIRVDEEKIFSRYLNPKKKRRNRKWPYFSLKLNRYAGRKARISFITRPGPRGDNSYCAAGWGRPHIVRL